MTRQTATATSPLRLDLVVRTSKRKAEARSPQQQRDMAQSCAETHGYNIARAHDSGRSESGKTMDRATLDAAMDRVRSGETDGIIVALTDRLGRAPIEDAMRFVRDLDGIGYLVLADCGGYPVDLSDPAAETNLVLQLQMARQYWLQTAKRFRQSREDAVKRGAYLARPPLGYTRSHHGAPLAVDEATAPVVREAFRRAARGDGLTDAMTYLVEALPERDWTTVVVRRMLANRAYLGENGVEGIAAKDGGAHQALVDPDTFAAAQSEPRSRRTSGHYALSGLLACGRCGAPMSGWLQATPSGRKYRRYRCGRCYRVAIGCDAVEQYMRDTLAGVLGDSAFRAHLNIGGLDDARTAVEQAESDLRAFATDLDLARTLGRKAFAAGAQARRQAVEVAAAVYRERAEANAQATTIPAADALSDPEALTAAVRAMCTSVVVKPGRGSVEARVQPWFPWTTDEVDDLVGAAAA